MPNTVRSYCPGANKQRLSSKRNVALPEGGGQLGVGKRTSLSVMGPILIASIRNEQLGGMFDQESLTAAASEQFD